jgi:hypothetical protein
MNKQSTPIPDASGDKSISPQKRLKRVKGSGEKPSRLKRIMTALGKRLFLVIISAVVVLAAAAAGAYITYRVQQEVWTQKMQQQEKQWLVDKRIELMERTYAMFSRGKVVKEMDEDYSKTILQAAGKVSRDPTKIIDVITKTVKERSLSRCGVMESRAEYRTLLKLNNVLFGEKTRQAVDALLTEDPWWGADSTLGESLLDAMAEEFLSEGYIE